MRGARQEVEAALARRRENEARRFPDLAREIRCAPSPPGTETVRRPPGRRQPRRPGTPARRSPSSAGGRRQASWPRSFRSSCARDHDAGPVIAPHPAPRRSSTSPLRRARGPWPVRRAAWRAAPPSAVCAMNASRSARALSMRSIRSWNFAIFSSMVAIRFFMRDGLARLGGLLRDHLLGSLSLAFRSFGAEHHGLVIVHVAIERLSRSRRPPATVGRRRRRAGNGRG